MINKVLKYGIMGVVCGILILFTAKTQYENATAKDNTEPEIVFSEDTLEANVGDDSSKLMTGVSAVDDVDGDVSSSLMVESIRRKTDGTYNEFNITYIAFDNSGNCGSATRTLIYSDYTAPHFEIKKPLRFTMDQDVNLTDYITAEDEIDGDLTAFIKISGLENYQLEKQEGLYECVASVTNSVGDTATIPITVEFYVNSFEDQTTHPQVILKQYVSYLKVGTEFVPGDYLDYIVDNGNKSIDFGPLVEVNTGEDTELVTQAVIDQKPGNWTNVANIKCKTNVDTSTPGTYKAIYTYTSEKSGYVGTAEMVLVVED